MMPTLPAPTISLPRRADADAIFRYHAADALRRAITFFHMSADMPFSQR